MVYNIQCRDPEYKKRKKYVIGGNSRQSERDQNQWKSVNTRLYNVP